MTDASTPRSKVAVGVSRAPARASTAALVAATASGIFLLVLPLSANAESSGDQRSWKAAGCPKGVHVKNGWGSFGVGKWPSACWRPYINKSFFNTRLPANPRILGNSKAMVNRILSLGDIKPLKTNAEIGQDWYHPYFFSRPTDPLYRIHCNKHSFRCPVEGRLVRIPFSARPASGDDAHMVVIDQRSGWEYDFWNVQSVPLPKAGGTITIGWGGKTRIIDGPGGGTGRTDSPAVMSATGAIGGVIRFQELAAGRIEHALFIVVGCSNGKTVYPARDYGGECSDTTNAPAAGQWLQLDMSNAQIARLSVPRWQKTILKAFARYGGFVGDTGGNEAFTFQLESPETYTSLGAANPYLAWAAKEVTRRNHNIITYGEGGVRRYALDIAEGVDWANKLRVIDPCVIRRRCRSAK